MAHSHGPPAEAPAIETHALTKRFGARIAVDAVELRVPRGCAFGFLGHNGAGKTTLIRMLLGLTPASSGAMRLLGLALPAQRAAALAGVGAIVEQPSLHGHLTGRENLRVAAAVRGAQAHARIPAVLARVGLADRADERVKGYSLGMRQRLGVARCLLADPELLILDEPTNGLDPAGMLDFRLMIRELVEQEGRTVFISTHLLDEVEKTCDAAAIVDRGRVLTQGSIAELAASEEDELLVDCDDPPLALRALEGDPAIRDVHRSERGVRIVLATGAPSHVAERVNRTLVDAGVAVRGLAPARPTLEQRFLEITNRIGVEA